MIELRNDSLLFSFPKVHPNAKLRIALQRTLRIPDEDKSYPLPPGLGEFPVRHVDDFAERVPAKWLAHGGVCVPMHQAEALWLQFDCSHVMDREAAYPFAIKVATGKIDAVTGEGWRPGVHTGPQDYMVAPEQPWLDGYCVENGLIRQFVAMPLGSGYSAEEQITGTAEHGGLQIVAYPMKREVFERRFPKIPPRVHSMRKGGPEMAMAPMPCAPMSADMEMGLAPGGRMTQEIYEDPFELSDWDTEHGSRVFVHIANSMVWRALTGEAPPTVPPTAREYTDAGLPWFDWYAEAPAVEGGGRLKGLKSILQIGKAKGDVPLPENETVSPEHVVRLRQGLGKDQVREGSF